MSLLGIDVGTSGCKAVVFSTDGRVLATAYEEYDVLHPRPTWAELDSREVWTKIQRTIARAAAAAREDPVRSLSVSSLGEATVPVSANRELLGPSLLNFDSRGGEYVDDLFGGIGPTVLYRLTGNSPGNHYTVTKLMWLRDHDPATYEGADLHLLWGSLVGYLLGGAAAVDHSLANRTLLFDLERRDWADDLVRAAGLDAAKLPRVVPAGTVIGEVCPQVARTMGLRDDVAIVAGAHDQCANAVGAGAVQLGRAMYGMGTFLRVVAPFARRSDPVEMIAPGLNTEHHAEQGLYVTFIYNHGGSMLKWYRDTFAGAEHRAASKLGCSVYPDLLAEMPAGPSGLIVLPHFETTGPPDFIANSRGMIVGLSLETKRGAVAKGILEGVIYYIRQCVSGLPTAGIEVDSFQAVGGGSQSDAWVQMSADILGKPIGRPQVREAGALGAAILAGVGTGVYASIAEGVDAMVRTERVFEPDASLQALYSDWYMRYTGLWPRLSDYLADISDGQSGLVRRSP